MLKKERARARGEEIVMVNMTHLLGACLVS